MLPPSSFSLPAAHVLALIGTLPSAYARAACDYCGGPTDPGLAGALTTRYAVCGPACYEALVAMPDAARHAHIDAVRAGTFPGVPSVV